VTVVELHERASVTGGSGSLDRMTARDMTLQYAEDGVTLERALLRGEALVVAAASSAGGPQRRFGGGTVDLDLDAEGRLVRAVGRDGVRVDLPGAESGTGQVVLGREFESSHDGTGALSGLRVDQDVSYREEGPARKARVAKGRALRLEIKNDSVQSAVFGGGSSFEEGPLTASADEIRYDLAGGRLTLTAGAAVPEPRLADEQLTLTAKKVDLTLGAKDITATGGVKTVLKPPSEKGEAGGQKLPGLLAQGQLVNVNADSLTSEAGGRRMSYVGSAMLWQGETAMRADSLTIDRAEGSLAASGAARVALPMSDGPASGRARSIRFDDSTRTLVLETPVDPVAARLGGARGAAVPAGPGAQSYLSASHGEVRAERIALVLAAASSATDHLDATGDVTLRVGERRASSSRLAYVASDERYELTGTAARPVNVVEACRATTGKTLVFYRSTDRILVDGNEETRTQTKSVGSCAPATR
jgi:lipopolysaccharide export system protein LptA